MSKSQELFTIFSPNDIVEITLCKEEIVKKNIENFLPSSILLKQVKELISLGPFPNNNPTQDNDELASQLMATPNSRVKITDLDNNSNVVEMTASILLLIVNCLVLTDEKLKEIKCAKVFTPYGPIDVYP